MARFLALIFTALSGTANAAQVLAITNNGEQVTVSYEALNNRSWRLNDDICLVSGSAELVCGYVGRLTKSEIIVQVTTRTVMPRGGQQVRLARESRSIASANIEETVRKKDNPVVDFTLGLNAGLNYFYPTAHISLAVSRSLALGIAPLYMNFTSSGVDVQAVGGFATLSYFHTHYAFRGLIFQGGFGFYDVSLKSATTEEKISPLAMQAQVQWRGKAHFALGIDIGIGAGLLYVFDKPTTTLKNNFSGVQPLFNLYVGYSL